MSAPTSVSAATLLLAAQALHQQPVNWLQMHAVFEAVDVEAAITGLRACGFEVPVVRCVVVLEDAGCLGHWAACRFSARDQALFGQHMAWAVRLGAADGQG